MLSIALPKIASPNHMWLSKLNKIKNQFPHYKKKISPVTPAIFQVLSNQIQLVVNYIRCADIAFHQHRKF